MSSSDGSPLCTVAVHSTAPATTSGSRARPSRGGPWCMPAMSPARVVPGIADSDSEQAIVDLATEYGLVTDYTSMVVVRDEVFEEHGIKRDNAARIATEQKARELRRAAPVRDNRRDAQQPAFSAPRAYPKTGNGGGAMGPWALVLLLPLLLAGKRKRLS